MSETIEIEFKNLLTKKEYQLLLRAFNIKDNDIFKQENHYFDTPSFALKELGSALRIRKKNNRYEFTLKQPAEVGLLETTQALSDEEFNLVIHESRLPNGIVQDRLANFAISPIDIAYFGSLITERAEFPYKNGLLVLDHSLYLNTEDYELEFEVDDYQQGQLVFHELLQQYAIPNRKTLNKIARFYQQKQLL
jgi:uncharacterized protein YjbK